MNLFKLWNLLKKCFLNCFFSLCFSLFWELVKFFPKIKSFSDLTLQQIAPVSFVPQTMCQFVLQIKWPTRMSANSVLHSVVGHVSITIVHKLFHYVSQLMLFLIFFVVLRIKYQGVCRTFGWCSNLT